MPKRFLLTVPLALLMAACAGSSGNARLSPDNPLIETVPDFLAEQEYLRRNLENGNPRTFNDAEWAHFDRLQQRFYSLLGDVASVDQLTTGEKQSLFDTRQALVTLLVGDGDLVCTRRQPSTGTRMGGGRMCVKRSRLEQERFNADLWRNQFESTPTNFDPDG